MYGIFYQAPTLKTFCVPEPIHLKFTASVSEALPTSPDVLLMSLLMMPCNQY
jgi:hypothetical protein